MSDYKFEQIPASEITSKGVKSLATRPNRPSQYGEGNLSAAALKQRFDDLAELVIEMYNKMATILSGKDALKYLNLPSGYFWSDAQNPSIADLLTRIIDGSGNVVAVDPVEKSVKDVSSIAESLYTLYTEVFALASLIKDDMLPTKQDNLSFDGEYNAETNKAATVETITRKVAEIVANAPENFDTLKELSDWLTSHEGSAAEMNSAIKQNAEDIKDLDSATKQNTDDIAEVTQKVNSLPDEITFEGLPDKPFGEVEGIDLITMNRGNGTVALNSGRKAYFQTDKTYTVDALIGGEARYQNDSNTQPYTITEAMIVDSTADGVTVDVADEYIIVAYTMNYIPTDKTTQLSSSPLPYVGVYFTEDSSGDYYIQSLSKEAIKRLDNKYLDLPNNSDFQELSEKVNSLPDEITFEGLPDKPFDGTEKININRVTNKGFVNLKSGRIAYFQTENTYTVDELIGATAVYCDDGPNVDYSVTQSMIIDATADGVTIKVRDEYIFIAYTTNYKPAQANAPLPNVGVYFSYSDGYYVHSLSKEANITKHLDGNFVKAYKHTVHIYGAYDSYGESVAKIYVSFLSTSSKPIATLQELQKSPACANGYLQCNYPRYQLYLMSEGMRDVHSVTISNGILNVEFITAYTIPATTMVHSFGPGISTGFYMSDTVTEV